MSPALAKRQSGKATFHFKDLDATMAAEVEALLARAYDIYMAGDEDKAEADGKAEGAGPVGAALRVGSPGTAIVRVFHPGGDAAQAGVQPACGRQAVTRRRGAPVVARRRDMRNTRGP